MSALARPADDHWSVGPIQGSIREIDEYGLDDHDRGLRARHPRVGDAVAASALDRAAHHVLSKFAMIFKRSELRLLTKFTIRLSAVNSS